MPASFDELHALAARRHGGAQALEAMLPLPKPPGALAVIPDDRWLAEMTKRVFQAVSTGASSRPSGKGSRRRSRASSRTVAR